MRWVVFALVAGCYSPAAQSGAPCSSTGACPSGQHCDFTTDPPLCAAADARPADAAPDTPPACTTNADCPGTAPVCEASTGFCRPCTADAQCDGDGVCTEYDGTCHNASNALFIGPAGSGTSCTRTSPCALATAIGKAANNQRIIVVTDGVYNTPFTIGAFGANSLTLSGLDSDPSGASVASSGPSACLLVDSSSAGKEVIVEGIILINGAASGVDNRGNLTLSRVEVRQNATLGIVTTGPALHLWDSRIRNNGTRGIDVTSGTLDIQRSQIDHNLSGGIDVSGAAFTIESSFIVDNGSATGSFGGLRVKSMQMPQTFVFNTVANNLAATGNAPGIQSEGALVLDSSILVDASQATCTPMFSVTPGTDPLFTAMGDYHIIGASPARGMANPNATTTLLDIDREPRVLGGARDCGADEIP